MSPLLTLYAGRITTTGTPTLTQDSPANAATGISTTPVIKFTGATSDTVQPISYEIQVDTQNNFKSGGSSSTPALVQKNWDATGVATLAFGTTPIVGNVIIVGIVVVTTNPGLPTDNANNTYSLLKSTHETTSGNYINIYMAPITQTLSGLTIQSTTAAATWYIAEYSGTDPTATILTNGAQSGSGSPTTSITTTVANSLIIVAGYDEGTVAQTAGTGLTVEENETDNVTHERAVFMDGIFATTGSQTLTWNNAVAPWAITAVCLQPFETTVPVIDAISTSAGFADVTHGGNTDPYPSGDQISYTVQSALSASTTYYWRVQQIATLGNPNYYQGWSATESFTTAAGVSISIAQVGANLVLTAGTQAVAVVAYTYANASISQVSANLVLTSGTQAISAVNSTNIAQVSSNLVLTGGTQSVNTGSVVNVTISQVSVNLVLTGGTQVVATVRNASISQTSANLVLTGGTQVVATVRNASISQTSANLVLTTGTQSVSSNIISSVSISQTAALLTLTSGTQVITTGSINNVSITQTHGSLTLTSGTQSIVAIAYTYASATVSQTHASLTLTSGTQAVATTVVVVRLSQLSGSLIFTGGSQTVVAINRLGRIEVYNGSSFALKPVNVWNGSTWARRKFQYYDGTKWVTTL
jgi:hypothetical protein